MRRSLMALGLSTGGSGGGEIQPYVNYDAKAGRMFRVDRFQQSDGTWATDKVEITNSVQMVMDLANIRVGWINYTMQGPVRKLVVLGQEPIPARPEGKNSDGKPAFKQGFEIELLLDKASGGGAPRVFGSAAACVIEAVDELHDAYTSAAESKAGKLPVVKIAGVQPVKSGQSTNYRPTFAIVNWLERPAPLAGSTAAVAAPASAPATGSTVVPPPAPQPAAMAGASDFG
jgi:hypothetical protein